MDKVIHKIAVRGTWVDGQKPVTSEDFPFISKYFLQFRDSFFDFFAFERQFFYFIDKHGKLVIKEDAPYGYSVMSAEEFENFLADFYKDRREVVGYILKKGTTSAEAKEFADICGTSLVDEWDILAKATRFKDVYTHYSYPHK